MADEHTGLVFNDVVPLPFRVIFLVQLGLFLWYSLVLFLYRFQRANVLGLLNLSYSAHNYSNIDNASHSGQNEQHRNAEFQSLAPAEYKENQLLLNGIRTKVRKLAVANVAAYLVFLFINSNYVKREQNGVFVAALYHVVPMVSFIYNFTELFLVPSALAAFGQYRVYTTMKRVLTGGINSKSMRTNDILISDSMVTYAKVLNDLVLFLWTTYYSEKISYSTELEAFVLSIPIWIRMKQCWFEYKLTKQSLHMFNLAKYASGFGPLMANYLIKQKLAALAASPEDEGVLLAQLNSLNASWYMLLLVNSSYSFLWDVKMDWGFRLFDNLFDVTSRRAPFIAVRPSGQILYGNYGAYYFGIVADFGLRFVWVLKVFLIKEEGRDLHIFNHAADFFFVGDVFSFGYAVLEVLEILRRWLWCFFKLEYDLIKMQAAESTSGSLNSDAVQMDAVDRLG